MHVRNSYIYNVADLLSHGFLLLLLENVLEGILLLEYLASLELHDPIKQIVENG